MGTNYDINEYTSNGFKEGMITVFGNFEGCITSLFWFPEGGTWKMYRQVHMIREYMDPTTQLQKT